MCIPLLCETLKFMSSELQLRADSNLKDCSGYVAEVSVHKIYAKFFGRPQFFSHLLKNFREIVLTLWRFC